MCMGGNGRTLRGHCAFAMFPLGRNLLRLGLLRRYIDTTALCIASSLFSIMCGLLKCWRTMVLGLACVRSWWCLITTYGKDILLLLGVCGCLGHFWWAMVVLILLWGLMLLIETQSSRRRLCSIFLFQMLRHQIRCKSCSQICFVLASSIMLLWLMCDTVIIIFRVFGLTDPANGNLITRGQRLWWFWIYLRGNLFYVRLERLSQARG